MYSYFVLIRYIFVICFHQAERGRTTIVIAHRLSTVKNADVIASISHGHVVEQGTHDQLIADGGLYARLVALQVSFLDNKIYTMMTGCRRPS